MRLALFSFLSLIACSQIFAMNESASDYLLELNFGGHICTLSRSMIANHGGAYLNNLLNAPETKPIFDSQGRLFIQLYRADGELFEYFMYTQKLPKKFDFESALRVEKLFQVPGLKDHIDRAPDPEMMKIFRAELGNIEYKNWRGKRLDDASIIAIAQVLKCNKTVSNLNLSQNHITDIGAASLADMLLVNNHLKKLCLCENNISKEGEKILTKALIYKDDFELCIQWSDSSDSSADSEQ